MLKPVATPEPLSDDEAAWLLKIYTLRRKDLFFAGSFRCFLRCVPLAFTLIFAWVFISGNIMSVPSFAVASISLAIMLTGAICLFINTYMILPYKKDALSGKKLRIAQKILAKEYYPVTGQYFFRLENDYEKLYEVDDATYNSLNENDVLYMYQGINSKHIFGDNDQVTYKFFTMRRLNSRY